MQVTGKHRLMTTLPASSHIIDDLIQQWDTPFVELAIFGTGNGQKIAHYLNTFCEQTLHSSIAAYLFYESSQGAVCGVQLADGRRVVIKVHQPRRDVAFLQAVYSAQRYLAEHSYPCPLPLLAPTPLMHGHAMVETLIDKGVYMDAHTPAIRRSMAQHLAQLASFTPALKDISGLSSTAIARQLPPGVLWPTPHSKIFDFEATTKGAEWIDQLAHAAKQVLDRGCGELIIGHTDWSVKHFRFLHGKVTVIYDWDSLALERETVIVGGAAVGFTMTWHLDVRLTPTPEEARAFIAEYEEARGKAFTADERRTINAAATYGLAYGARCYQSIQKDPADIPPGTALETLMHYQGNFLDL